MDLDIGSRKTRGLTRDLLMQCGDVETNPGPTGRRSVAQGPTLDEQVRGIIIQMVCKFVMSIDKVYTLNSQMTEMTTTTETLTNNIKNLQENFDSKLEILRNGWKFIPKP